MSYASNFAKYLPCLMVETTNVNNNPPVIAKPNTSKMVTEAKDKFI
jgi:hypothetical protein